MASDLVLRDGWIARVLRALRVVDVSPDGETTHLAGADYASPLPASRTFNALHSMSAMAAFPYVRACCDAISSDITKLQLQVVRGRGKNAEIVEDHPFLDLMDQTSSRQSGLEFRRQMIVDLVLTGDCFAVIGKAREPAALIRLHPERVKINSTADGQVSHYEYDSGGSVVHYSYEDVFHVSQTSWTSTPGSLYGSGAIEALNNDLQTDLAASKLAAESAKTGVPNGILSPVDPADSWSKAQVTILREAFERQLQGKSGTLILGSGVSYSQISQSLRDMEYQTTREMALRAVLAAFGVVPVRVGIEGSNYATSQSQLKIYWENLQSKAMLIAGAYTRVLRQFDDSADLRVVHDFSSVSALQEDRTAAVNRVNAWWMMGVDLAQAAALEGIDELSTEDIEERPEEADESEEVATQSFTRWLVVDGKNSKDMVAENVQTAEGRALIWRGFIQNLHTPGERKISLHMRRYLRAQAARIGDRASKELGASKSGVVGIQKADDTFSAGAGFKLDQILADKILDEVYERGQLLNIFRPLYRDIIEDGFKLASQTIDPGLLVSQDEINRQVNATVGDMINKTMKTTADSVKLLLEKQLTEGATLKEITAGLMQDKAFNPVRAMAIARTETTRLATKSTNLAYDKAEESGLKIEKVWISARDGKVRKAHEKLDGESVPNGAMFTANGDSGAGPGEFSDAALNVNCRCTTVGRAIK